MKENPEVAAPATKGILLGLVLSVALGNSEANRMGLPVNGTVGEFEPNV